MGDFNVAPSNLDIHDPKKYEGGIMASEIERNALNNVLKKITRFVQDFLKKILAIGVGGITVITHLN